MEVAHSNATDGQSDHILLTTDHIIYAGGLYHHPYIPSIHGLNTYRGQHTHSSQLTNFTELANKSVVIVGLGNTAWDFATMIYPHCRHLSLSGRGNTWLIPKSINQLPIDQFVQHLQSTYGENYRVQLLKHCLEHKAFFFGENITKDSLNFRKARISVNNDILAPLQEGRITTYPAIEYIEGDTIFFHNGQSTKVDHLIFCTGFDQKLPFIRGHQYSHNALIGNVLHPTCDHYWLVGAPAVWGGIATHC